MLGQLSVLCCAPHPCSSHLSTQHCYSIIDYTVLVWCPQIRLGTMFCVSLLFGIVCTRVSCFRTVSWNWRVNPPIPPGAPLPTAPPPVLRPRCPSGVLPFLALLLVLSLATCPWFPGVPVREEPRRARLWETEEVASWDQQSGGWEWWRAGPHPNPEPFPHLPRPRLPAVSSLLVYRRL